MPIHTAQPKAFRCDGQGTAASTETSIKAQQRPVTTKIRSNGSGTSRNDGSIGKVFAVLGFPRSEPETHTFPSHLSSADNVLGSKDSTIINEKGRTERPKSSEHALHQTNGQRAYFRNAPVYLFSVRSDWLYKYAEK